MALQSFLPNPVFHWDTSTGAPASGWQIFFFENGTSTAKAVYRNVNGTLPWPNTEIPDTGAFAPCVTLDTNGNAKIYGSGVYKIRIYDDSGVFVDEMDDVEVMLSANALQSLIQASVINYITVENIGAYEHLHNTDFTPVEVPDGSRTGFSTSQVFIAGSLEVMENGTTLLSGSDFTEDGDKRGYNFNGYAPRVGAIIQHRYLVDLTTL